LRNKKEAIITSLNILTIDTTQGFRFPGSDSHDQIVKVITQSGAPGRERWEKGRKAGGF
jgi:hypothetical protein